MLKKLHVFGLFQMLKRLRRAPIYFGTTYIYHLMWWKGALQLTQLTQQFPQEIYQPND